METADDPSALPKYRVALLSAAGVLLVGLLDFVTGYELRLFPLYFLPITFGAWRLSRGAAVALALFSTVTWTAANWQATFASPIVWPVNFVAQLVSFGAVGLLVAELRRRLVVEQSLSREDALTSLPNRRAFLERAELLLAVALRAKRPLTFAFLDLDNFKRVNDERGHDEGDRVLAQTAAILRRQCRVSDLVARLGGDEFVILLADTGADAARIPLERVRQAVATSMQESGWPVTLSVGAIGYDLPPSSVEEALQGADALMYRAKEGGKNRVHLEARGEPVGGD